MTTAATVHAPQTDAPEGRTQRKRRAIIDAATALFLRNGYQGTTMDQIAADAAVSKQTVYKQFSDKEQLFRDIVLGVTGNSDAIIADLTGILSDAEPHTDDDLRSVLTAMVGTYLDAVLQPRVLALRRLIIAETERFPELAHTYYTQAPSRGMELIAAAIKTYQDQGLLAVRDPKLAAAHLAYLALGFSQDRAHFYPDQPPDPETRRQLTTEAVRVFLAAYAAT